MTDRDTLAAAALTGLLANEGEGPSLSNTCAYAYRIADAMLRERERTNHDAAPAARARTDADRDRTDNAATRPGLGTGDTQEPVAWGVASSSGGVLATSISRIDAVDMQSDYAFDTAVVPLYRSPTLAATPPLHTTHGECSVPPECTQPVAWWVTLPGRDFPYLSHIKDRAIFCQKDEPGSEVVPLYRSPPVSSSDTFSDARNSGESGKPTLTDAERDAEIERLRDAIRRLADQDATLSVCGGNVTVTMDATLTDEEREAIRWFAGYGDLQAEARRAEVLLGLLRRLG